MVLISCTSKNTIRGLVPIFWGVAIKRCSYFGLGLDGWLMSCLCLKVCFVLCERFHIPPFSGYGVDLFRVDLSFASRCPENAVEVEGTSALYFIAHLICFIINLLSGIGS